MKVVLCNHTLLGAQHYVNRTSGVQGVRAILPQWSLTLCPSGEKLLCGQLNRLQAASLETCFAVCVILALNSSSFQCDEAVTVVQEHHLCGCICVDDILHLLQWWGRIGPTVFTSVGLIEYVSILLIV